MPLTIEGGVAQVIDNDRIEVKLGATLKNGDAVVSTGGISIKVLGRVCHVVQFFKRSFFSHDQGGLVSGTTLTNRGYRAELTANDGEKFHVDTADNTNPYYDSHPQSPCVRTDSSLTMYDKPDLVGSGTLLSMTSPNDWSTFTALAFCIADGETVATLEWTVRKAGKDAEVYTVKRHPRDNLQIIAANLIMLSQGFKGGQYIPLRPIVGVIESPVQKTESV